MRRHLQETRGMTLVELMIVLLVFSLVMGAVYSLFSTSLQAYWKGDLATQVQQSGRISLERVSRDLRQARRVITGAVAGGFTFNTSCTPYQISVALPHLGTATLADGTQIYTTAPYSSGQPYVGQAPYVGQVPYDGWYVSWYLSATRGGTIPDATGPYLERASYDGVTLVTATVATNMTSLAFLSGGSCPVAWASTTSPGSREISMILTSSQTAVGQRNTTSTNVVTSDVTLRNQ